MRDSPPPRRLILGSGRSGTTWVLDCVADANDLRPIFEPLHPATSALGSRYAYRMMLPGDHEEILEEYFSELAAGRIWSRWINYRGRRDRLFPSPASLLSAKALNNWRRRWVKYLRDRPALVKASKRGDVVIKCIRANLMAGWLTRELGFRTVLVIRHPGAVIESQYRLGEVWDPSEVLARYRADRKLHEVTGGVYLKLLESRLTKLQGLTLNWVIENQWPVEKSQEDGYGIFYYEELVSHPLMSWQRLSECLGLKQLPDLTRLHKPSQQASGAPVQQGAGAARKPRWRSSLSQDQLDTIQRILDATECNLYHVNVDDPLQARIKRETHSDL
jgi:hypothetical protein